MFKNSAPTILIASGANLIGLKLTEILLDQGSNVIMLDEYDESKIHFAKHFKKNDKFKFIEQDSFNNIKDDIKKLEYTFVLLYEKKFGSNNISSKNFINITQFIDNVLEFTQYKKAKSILVTSIDAQKKYIEDKELAKAYSFVEVQKHAEKIAKEYIQELNLNNRIIRIANVVGPQMDIDEDLEITRLIKEALTRDYITIYGDGLEYEYYIFIMDAVYGLVKAIFDDKTKDQIIYLSGTEPISLLAIANRIIKSKVQANAIKFENKNIIDDNMVANSFTLSNSLSDYGWKPNFDIQQTLDQTIEYIREKLGIDNIIPNKERINPNTSSINFEKEEERVFVKVKKQYVPLNLKNLKSHSKFKFLFVILLLSVFVGVFFMAILPITNTLSLSSQQTEILGEINRSIAVDKSLTSTDNALKKLNDSNGLDQLESRLKSLEFITGITGQKNSYQTFLKTFAAYQDYIMAIQKIANNNSLSKSIYEGTPINNPDLLSIQTLTDVKTQLNTGIDSMKNVSTILLPHDTRKEVDTMLSISKDLIRRLTL